MAGEYTAQISPTGGGLGNEHLRTGAAIAAAKVKQRTVISGEIYDDGTTVVALSSLLVFMAPVAGTLRSIEIWCTTAPTGADRTVDLDVQKGSSGGAYATIMTANAQITNSTSAREAVAGTFSSTALSAGDSLQFVVTVAGAAGAQAVGLGYTLVLDLDEDVT